jgi:hypothetical protein
MDQHLYDHDHRLGLYGTVRMTDADWLKVEQGFLAAARRNLYDYEQRQAGDLIPERWDNLIADTRKEVAYWEQKLGDSA